MKGIMGTLAVLLSLLFFVYLGVVIYKSVVFDIGCTDRLKRAADSNTVGLATKEMEAVLAYIEKEGPTSGYTSILYRTPDEDVGFWYANLKSALEELKIVKPDATQLEKSNLLIKLRETLLDEGKKTSVTLPPGISLFPNNTAYSIWGLLSFVFAFIFLCISVAVVERY